MKVIKDRAFPNIRIVFLCSILVIALLGCSNASLRATPTVDPDPYVWMTPTMNPMIKDGGLISHEPCGPPCFFGFYVNDNFKIAVDKLDAIHSTEYGSNGCIIDEFTVGRQIRCPGVRVSSETESNKISGIAFSVDSQVSVGDLIDTYGEPTSLEVFDLLDVHNPSMRMRLLYQDFWGVIFLEIQPLIEDYHAEPTTLVKEVGYLTEADYIQSSEGTIPWRGYGYYGITSTLDFSE